MVTRPILPNFSNFHLARNVLRIRCSAGRRVDQLMGTMQKLTCCAILILISCGRTTESADHTFYVERRLGFYDPENEDFTLDTWIRKPENIRTAHETLKKFGYLKIFSADELATGPCMIWSYINKPCHILIDSLILTYPPDENDPKYYREFWSRRKREKNDTTVYAVLKEVKDILINKRRLMHDERLTNDTIYNLLRIRFTPPGSEAEALQNFLYLTGIGLNLSAYNVLYESTWYENLNWDREALRTKLLVDTAYCCAFPVIPDNTK